MTTAAIDWDRATHAWNAADAIMALPSKDGQTMVNVVGCNDGRVNVQTPAPGKYDILISYAGDSFDLHLSLPHLSPPVEETVSGRMHVLRAVLARRILRVFMARIPANREALGSLL